MGRELYNCPCWHGVRCESEASHCVGPIGAVRPACGLGPRVWAIGPWRVAWGVGPPFDNVGWSLVEELHFAAL